MIPKIIVVDDEADILKPLVFRLGLKGYQVLTAARGDKGWELIRSVKPDLVFLDQHLPGMDGTRIYEQMLKHEDLKKIPVVILTAETEPMELDRIRAMKPAALVQKPFEAEEILRLAETHLNKA